MPESLSLAVCWQQQNPEEGIRPFAGKDHSH